VLATGRELIDDIRRAPDHVLSRIEPINEVCSVSVQNGAFIQYLLTIRLVHSARIHAILIGRARRIHHGHSSFEICAGYARYFPGDQRRTRYGHGRFSPETR